MYLQLPVSYVSIDYFFAPKMTRSDAVGEEGAQKETQEEGQAQEEGQETGQRKESIKQ